jgi:methionyl-tRNA formyltransferase
MEKGVDTGDILKIRKIPLKEKDTIKNIRTRFEPLMVEEMVAVVLDFLNHKIKPVKQEIKEGKQFFVISKPLLEKCKVKLANRLK